MGRPARPDGRLAAAVAALGQNMLEGPRRRPLNYITLLLRFKTQSFHLGRGRGAEVAKL